MLSQGNFITRVRLADGTYSQYYYNLYLDKIEFATKTKTDDVISRDYNNSGETIASVTLKEGNTVTFETKMGNYRHIKEMQYGGDAVDYTTDSEPFSETITFFDRPEKIVVIPHTPIKTITMSADGVTYTEGLDYSVRRESGAIEPINSDLLNKTVTIAGTTDAVKGYKIKQERTNVVLLGTLTVKDMQSGEFITVQGIEFNLTPSGNIDWLAPEHQVVKFEGSSIYRGSPLQYNVYQKLTTS